MQDTLRILLPIVGAHVAVLGVLLVVVKQVLMSDARRAIARVSEVENEVRKKEEGVRREIAEHEKDFARRKAEAEADLQRRRDSADKDVTRLKEQAAADAKREAGQILEQARRNEQKLRLQLAQEAEEKAVGYGAEVFRLVFSEKMGRELHRQFMEELLEALGEIDGTSVTVEGDSAEFTCSHPLEADQKQRFQALLADKFGVRVEVNEKLDESLLAGMVFKLGTLEIDGSLRNRYHEATAEVIKEAHEKTAQA